MGKLARPHQATNDLALQLVDLLARLAESKVSKLATVAPKTQICFGVVDGEFPILWVKTTWENLAALMIVENLIPSQFSKEYKKNHKPIEDRIRYLIDAPQLAILRQRIGLEKKRHSYNFPDLAPCERGEFLLAVKFLTLIPTQDLKIIKRKVLLENIEISNESIIEKALSVERLFDFIHIRWQPYFSEHYGLIRLFGLPERKSILALYTHAKMWEERLQSQSSPTPRSSLLAQTQADLLSRFNYGSELPKTSGWEIAIKNSRLLIFGSPGIGKTMFLLYLLERCNQGAFLPNKLPVLVQLNRYSYTLDELISKTLLNYLESEFTTANIRGEDVENLLQHGKLLIGIDGLDEVPIQKLERVIQEIKIFIRQYPANHYFITCRSAFNQYRFYQENFKEVEISGFDRVQMEQCIIKWFDNYGEITHDYTANSLIEALKQPVNQPTRELAETPLLLNLICIIFRTTGNLPKSRNQLFERAINLLQQDWDIQVKGVRRDPILLASSTGKVLDLLEKLAKDTFAANQMFMNRNYIVNKFIEYLDLNHFELDNSNEIKIKSADILNGICLNHGFLIEKGFEVYSFLHLSFHEYFVAREICRTDKFTQLVQYGIDPRWWEVFFHCVEMPASADRLLLLMLKHSRRMVKKSHLQPLVRLINHYIDKINIDYPYKLSALQAYFLSSLPLDFDMPIEVFRRGGEASNLSSALGLSRTMAIDPIFDQNLQTAMQVIQVLPNILSVIGSGELEMQIVTALNNPPASVIIEAILPACLSSIANIFQEVEAQAPETNPLMWTRWWKLGGKKWTTDLLNAIAATKLKVTKYSQERENLTTNIISENISVPSCQNLYNLCFLIAACLNRAALVSDSVRQQIETQLLICEED